MNKRKVHFTEKSLLQATNPISVNLIGAGGTGSQVLTALARINHSLVALGHAGLQVRVFDDDAVTAANLGRQLFSPAELGLNKGVALINRLNRFFGLNWKAVAKKYCNRTLGSGNYDSAITISCVDTVSARFEIAGMLSATTDHKHRNKPIYWLDYGNSQYTGQVLLSTVGKVKQPASRKFEPVDCLPFITEEYKDLLQQTDEKALPSCSLAEALRKQDLFINPTLANMGASLLWQLFREGMISNRGFFLNLQDFRSVPIPV